MGSSPEAIAWLLFAGLVVVTLLVLLLRGLSRKPARLKHGEREQLLISLRQWMHGDKPPLEHGEKS